MRFDNLVVDVSGSWQPHDSDGNSGSLDDHVSCVDPSIKLGSNSVFVCLPGLFVIYYFLLFTVRGLLWLQIVWSRVSSFLLNNLIREIISATYRSEGPRHGPLLLYVAEIISALYFQYSFLVHVHYSFLVQEDFRTAFLSEEISVSVFLSRL
jgi:hypothetical protein